MSVSAQSGTTLPKTSQRAVKSCNFCYRRKVKCDQNEPCSRCVARGIGDLCQRETRLVRGRLVGTLSSTSNHVQSYAELLEENKSLHRRVHAQEQSIANLYEQLVHPNQGSIPSSSPDVVTIGEATQSSAGHRTQNSSPESTDDSLEILSSVARLKGMVEWPPTQPVVATSVNDLLVITTLNLVNTTVSTYLIKFHFDALWWFHPVVDIAAFISEHDEWVRQRQLEMEVPKPYDFLSLYFVVIASALYFMDEEEAVSIGLTADLHSTFIRVWLESSLHCLQKSNFLSSPTLVGLQTICILPMIAHTFGQSSLLASYMHIGLNVIHRLETPLNLEETRSRSKTATGGLVEELGRRIWVCLSVWECFGSEHFTRMGLIYPPVHVRPPLNVFDNEISATGEVIARPLGLTTPISHLIAMGRLAQLTRNLYRALNGVDDQWQRYLLTRQYDDEVTRSLQEFPDLRPSDLPHPSDPEYRLCVSVQNYTPWSRYIWSVTTCGVRILAYRPFLALSYKKGTQWQEVKKICLVSARTILQQRRAPVPRMWLKAWHLSADVSLAGMILANELLHGDGDVHVNASLQQDIQECIDFLSANDSANMIMYRSAHTLRRMLEIYSTISQPGIYQDTTATLHWSSDNFDRWLDGFLNDPISTASQVDS